MKLYRNLITHVCISENKLNYTIFVATRKIYSYKVQFSASTVACFWICATTFCNRSSYKSATKDRTLAYIAALCAVMLCGLVCGNQRLGGTYHHHLQGRYVDRGLWNVSNHYKTTQHHIQKPIADTFPAVRT